MKDSRKRSLLPQVSVADRSGSISLPEKPAVIHCLDPETLRTSWCGIEAVNKPWILFNDPWKSPDFTCKRCLSALLNAKFEYVGPKRKP